jgi:hypothetical protein
MPAISTYSQCRRFSIFWEHAFEEPLGSLFYVGTGSLLAISYSIVEGGYLGLGNSSEDPLVIGPEVLDFRLQPGSPCIDAADGAAAPEFDIDGNPRVDDPDSPNNGIGPPWADMGAYEFQL